jgi:hypothetical protein
MLSFSSLTQSPILTSVNQMWQNCQGTVVTLEPKKAYGRVETELQKLLILIGVRKPGASGRSGDSILYCGP